MPEGISNTGHTLIVPALPYTKIIPNFLLQKFPILNGLALWLDRRLLVRMQKVGILGLHAKRCVQWLD
jgi:hypothetical protein